MLGAPGQSGLIGVISALMSLAPVWIQVAILAAAVVALHLRRAGRWRAPPAREVAAAVILCCGLFLLASGGKGLSGPSAMAPDDAAEDAPDPFHRSSGR